MGPAPAIIQCQQLEPHRTRTHQLTIGPFRKIGPGQPLQQCEFGGVELQPGAGKAAKREAFLQDQDLVRVLYPEDAWGAGASDVLEAAANDIAADLATLGDRVVCAVLEARGVR